MPACHAGDRRFESGRVRHTSHLTSRPVRPPGRGVLLPAGERSRIASGRWQQSRAGEAPTRVPSSSARSCSSRSPARRVGHATAVGATGRLRARPPSARPPGPRRRDSPLAGRRPEPARAVAGRVQSARADAPVDAPLADVPDRARRAVPDDGRRDRPRRRLGGARGDGHDVARRWSSSRARRDAILAGLGVDRPAGSTSLVLAPDAATADEGPREEPEAARRPPGRRRRGPVSGRSAGAAARCSASTRSRRPPTGASPRGSRNRATPPVFDPGGVVDARRGRRHHARPGRRPDAQDPGQGRRLPVQRRHGRHHRPRSAARRSAGTGPDDSPDRRRGRRAPPRVEAPTSRSRTSRTRRRTPSATTRRGRSSRPTRKLIAGLARRRDRLGRDRQQPHPRRRRDRDPPDDREPQAVRDHARAAPARTSPPPASRRSSTRTA